MQLLHSPWEGIQATGHQHSQAAAPVSTIRCLEYAQGLKINSRDFGVAQSSPSTIRSPALLSPLGQRSPPQRVIYTGKKSWKIRCCSGRRAGSCSVHRERAPASAMAALRCFHRIPHPLRARSQGAEDKDGLFRP